MRQDSLNFIVNFYFCLWEVRIFERHKMKVMNMKITTAFWDVKPCSLVDVYQCFRALSVSAFRVA
jgi:hypothetical protein